MVFFRVKVHGLPTSNDREDPAALARIAAETEPRIGPEHGRLPGIAPCRKVRECCVECYDFEVEDGNNVPGELPVSWRGAIGSS